MAVIEHQDAIAHEEIDDDLEGQLSLRDIVSILLAGKWTLIAFTVGAVLLAVGYLYHATPIFQANALLQVEQNQLPNASMDQLQQMAQLITGGSTPAEAEIQILQSRSVIGHVVRSLGLDIVDKPKYFPFFGAAVARHYHGDGVAAPWFGLSHDSWGGSKIKVTRLIVPDALKDTPLTLIAEGTQQFKLKDEKGHVLLSGRVGQAVKSSDGAVQIFVAVLHGRPGQHFEVERTRWLEAVNALKKRLTVTEQGKDSGIIQMTLSGAHPVLIHTILNAIADTFLRQNVQQKSAQAQQSLTFIQKQLPKLKNQLDAAESKYAGYREKHQAADLSGEAAAVLKQLVDVEQNIEKLKLKRSQYAQLYTARHPEVKALEQQLGTLRQKKRELEQQISRMPQKEKKILELKRDVDVNTQIYTSLLNESQQLQIVKAGTVGSVRIVDHAAVPDKPISPNSKSSLILAVFLGLLAGVGWLFLRRALHPGINDPKEMEERLGLPVYAVVPHSTTLQVATRAALKQKQAVPILAREHSQDEAVEALRSLRTSLHFALMESSRKSIMITGPAPGVGKSFISMNLGELIASSGQKVVVVDADMRRGRLHQYLSGDRTPGLSDVLSDTAPIDSATHVVPGSELAVVPTGTIPPNPSELLMHERFGELVHTLEDRYDVVLIDTPPLMAVTDAAIVSPHVGATFVVVKASETSMPELEESVKRLRQNRTRVHGLLFNDFRPKAAAGNYGAYAYYRYYRYKYK